MTRTIYEWRGNIRIRSIIREAPETELGATEIGCILIDGSYLIAHEENIYLSNQFISPAVLPSLQLFDTLFPSRADKVLRTICHATCSALCQR